MAQKQGWVIAAIIFACFIFLIFAASIFISGFRGGMDDSSSGGSKIALVELEGVISDSEEIIRQLDKYSENRSVKGIVLRIDSPGGGVTASQEIYEKVKRVRDSGLPIVASMGSVAASGGYYAALGADTIFASPSTMTGSIGVIAEIPNTQKLFDKLGIQFNTIKSGKFKDTGSPYREMTIEDRRYLQNMVDNHFQQFVDAVVTERNMSRSQVLKYADGRVYTGLQALEYGLIDTLGLYEDAINFAAELAGISGEPKTIKEKKRKMTWFDLMFEDVNILFSRIERWPRLKYQLIM
ncbi:signal peptide peptidase SppA [candidate division KSB1 bacterium]|nr:signal peptide peptidase SppA [candidate division KSB1 bacterium]